MLTYRFRTYVPARTAWAPPVPEHGPMSPLDASMPVRTNGPEISSVTIPTPRHHRTGSDSYYEDVEPRFASDPDPIPTISHTAGSHVSLLPNSLMPGGPGLGVPHRTSPQHLAVDDGHSAGAASVEGDSSYENIAEGQRSPAGSDVSHFTSVSQRGVNPNWRPGPQSGPGMSGMGHNNGVATQRRNERNDMLLGANPDFSIPGMGPPRGVGRGRAAPMGMRPAPGPGGLTPQGRYPTDL